MLAVKMAGAGVPPGLGRGGFVEMREARNCFYRMVSEKERLSQIAKHVESDVLNMEKYVKKMAGVCKELFRATGAMSSRRA
jgi:hypothetical protein